MKRKESIYNSPLLAFLFLVFVYFSIRNTIALIFILLKYWSLKEIFIQPIDFLLLILFSLVSLLASEERKEKENNPSMSYRNQYYFYCEKGGRLFLKLEGMKRKYGGRGRNYY